MNRRQFNATAVAAAFLPSILLPRQRVRHIDLSMFCEEEASYRYEMRQPFQQEGLNYATDSIVCVRTSLPVQMSESAETVRLPKACGLPWRHDQLTGWQPWSKYHFVPYEHGCICPKCFGKGRVGEGVRECARCYGSGNDYQPSGDGDYSRVRCECTAGWTGGAQCGSCTGTGKVDFAIELGGCKIAPEYHAKIATLGEVEFSVAQGLFDVKKSGIDEVVLFRGADVEGMVAMVSP